MERFAFAAIGKSNYRIAVSEWRRANPEKIHAKQAKYRRLRPRDELEHRVRYEYQFTEPEIEYILRWRGGKCPCCGKMIKRLGVGLSDGCIEHDHKTKRFRGIVCGSCNRALGYVQDKISVLRGLIKYLRG